MDLVILCLGKTREINQKKIIEDYIKKINYFLKCRIKILTNKKKINSINERKKIESKLITKNIDKTDYVIVFYSENEFAKILNNHRTKHNFSSP